MKFTRLFRFRILDMKRRLSGGGVVAGALSVILVIAGGWVVTQGLVAWAFSPLADCVDELVADPTHFRLTGEEAFGCEAAVHQIPPAFVVRVVEVDHGRNPGPRFRP